MPEHGVAIVAAHEPGGTAATLPAHGLGARAPERRLEHRRLGLPQARGVEHNRPRPARIAEGLLAFDGGEVSGAVGRDDLEPGQTTVAALVPPPLVERPWAGPPDDRLRRTGVDRQDRRWRAQLAAPADDDGATVLVGDDSGDTVAFPRHLAVVSRTRVGDGAGRAPGQGGD